MREGGSFEDFAEFMSLHVPSKIGLSGAGRLCFFRVRALGLILFHFRTLGGFVVPFLHSSDITCQSITFFMIGNVSPYLACFLDQCPSLIPVSLFVKVFDSS